VEAETRGARFAIVAKHWLSKLHPLKEDEKKKKTERVTWQENRSEKGRGQFTGTGGPNKGGAA